MKRIFAICVAVAFSLSAAGQGAVQRENLDRQPAWGPSGYPLAEYYYIPAPDVYYDVDNAVFYVKRGKRWVAEQVLPEESRDINLYACYKVVMNGEQPWRNHTNHTFAYERYRTRRFVQPTIGRDDSASGGRRADKGKHNPRKESRRRL